MVQIENHIGHFKYQDGLTRIEIKISKSKDRLNQLIKPQDQNIFLKNFRKTVRSILRVISKRTTFKNLSFQVGQFSIVTLLKFYKLYYKYIFKR